MNGQDETPASVETVKKPWFCDQDNPVMLTYRQFRELLGGWTDDMLDQQMQMAPPLIYKSCPLILYPVCGVGSVAELHEPNPPEVIGYPKANQDNVDTIILQTTWNHHGMMTAMAEGKFKALEESGAASTTDDLINALMGGLAKDDLVLHDIVHRLPGWGIAVYDHKLVEEDQKNGMRLPGVRVDSFHPTVREAVMAKLMQIFAQSTPDLNNGCGLPARPINIQNVKDSENVNDESPLTLFIPED